MYKMRHIATSLNGSYFLTAEFKEKVYCWDIDTFKCISEFNTKLDFGGNRLAITEDGTHCIAAAYSRYGVSMYDVSNGSIVWQRKDIKKTQYVVLNPSNDKIYLGLEERSMIILNRNDGEGDEKIRSATKIYFDRLKAKPLFIKGRNQIIFDKIKIKSPTFTFLDVQPVGTGVVMSAVGSELFYYDYTKNEITWKIMPQNGEHFIKLSYSSDNETIYAVLYKYSGERKEPIFILYGISIFDGHIKFTFPLSSTSCEFGFAKNATKLICSNGEIYELSDEIPKLTYQFNWE